MRRLGITVGVLTAALLFAAPATAQEGATAGDGNDGKYLVFRANTAEKMEQELNQAGAEGYRFAAVSDDSQGVDRVVVMTLDPGGGKYRYIVPSTVRASTLQRELNEAPPAYRVVGMTMFLRGLENTVILEADLGNQAE